MAETATRDSRIDDWKYHLRRTWRELTCGNFVERPQAARSAILAAEALLAQGQARQAEKQAVRAIRWRPGLQQGYEMLGKALDAQQRTDEATACFRGELPEALVKRYFRAGRGPVPSAMTIDSGHGVSGVRRQIIHEQRSYSLPPLMTLTPNSPRQLRQDSLSSAVTRVDTIDGGALWHDMFNSMLFDRNGRALSDPLLGNLPVVESVRRRCRPVHLGRRVFLLGARGAGNYFHWMTDILPKLELARLAGYEFTPEDRFVVSFEKCAFQRATIAHLGIGPEQLFFTDKASPYISADQIIVPVLRNRMLTGAGDWLPAWLRQSFLQPVDAATSGRRLYVSRASPAATGRGIENADAVSRLLAERGFEEVFPEKMSVPQQAQLFADAAMIVAPHGAGLTNLAFCQPGTVVVELYGAHLAPCYRALSALCSLHYLNLDCSESDQDVQDQAQFVRTLNARRGTGFRVDTRLLAQTIDLAESVASPLKTA